MQDHCTYVMNTHIQTLIPVLCMATMTKGWKHKYKTYKKCNKQHFKNETCMII